MNKTKRKSAVVVLTGILLLGVLTLSTGVASAENSTFTRVEEAPVEEYERIGILVVGHGSPSDSWCAPLRSAVHIIT
jgi:hypothetical protein